MRAKFNFFLVFPDLGWLAIGITKQTMLTLSKIQVLRHETQLHIPPVQVSVPHRSLCGGFSKFFYTTTYRRALNNWSRATTYQTQKREIPAHPWLSPVSMPFIPCCALGRENSLLCELLKWRNFLAEPRTLGAKFTFIPRGFLSLLTGSFHWAIEAQVTPDIPWIRSKSSNLITVWESLLERRNFSYGVFRSFFSLRVGFFSKAQACFIPRLQFLTF